MAVRRACVRACERIYFVSGQSLRGGIGSTHCEDCWTPRLVPVVWCVLRATVSLALPGGDRERCHRLRFPCVSPVLVGGCPQRDEQLLGRIGIITPYRAQVGSRTRYAKTVAGFACEGLYGAKPWGVSVRRVFISVPAQVCFLPSLPPPLFER